MTRYLNSLFSALLLLGSSGFAIADEASQPKAIPATRAEAKEALERLKHRQPRLPLPPLTEEEQAQRREGSSGSGLGGGVVNNGRMRNLYLPLELRGSRGTRSTAARTGEARGPSNRPRDPNMTLDNAFGVELFWIASRANNCHYCLGHQEQKLLSAGLEEPRIAALDSDWSQFTPAERAAYTLAKKLTLRPDLLTDDDFAEVSRHYEPRQVLEIVVLVSRYNATNRWTDSLGIPQEGHRNFLTETPEQFAKAKSIVAPTRIEMRPLASREETQSELARCADRKARLPVLDEAQAREVVPKELVADPLPQWVRLLANFPMTGKSQIEAYRLAEDKGTLSAELKAQIAWTAARQDRAWYALDQAARRLRRLGYDQDRMFTLDAAAGKPTDAASEAMAFARKLTATPQAIADADIARLQKHYENGAVAEIVHQVTQAAFFNRLTEAAALPLEPQL